MQTLTPPSPPPPSPPHPINPSQLKVWFVHDWLNGMRGGEKVLLHLIQLFPNSQIATLFHLKNSTHPDIESRIAKTSFLHRLPGINRHYRNLLPLMPAAIRSINLPRPPSYDLVISTSHCVAKGITLPPHTPHLCYCFTPMRYLWDMQDHYISPRTPKALLLKTLAAPLRRTDLHFNHSVTQFVATCQNVADRIQRCYQKTAAIAYPGIDENFYTPPLILFQHSAFSIQH